MLSHAHPQPILVADAQLSCKKVMLDADSLQGLPLASSREIPGAYA